jgi:hypothetical protein
LFYYVEELVSVRWELNEAVPGPMYENENWAVNASGKKNFERARTHF